MLKKIVSFQICVGKIRTKLAIFYKILTLNLIILDWPLFICEDLAFFETASGLIWPFLFFEPGNSVLSGKGEGFLI
jgi:hypothetical protein